jgi:ATP-dependent Clp protease ATP-binding subunit ClpC
MLASLDVLFGLIVLGLAVGGLIAFVGHARDRLRRSRGRGAGSGSDTHASTAPRTPVLAVLSNEAVVKCRAIAGELRSRLGSPDADRLAGDEAFSRAAALLADPAVPVDVVVELPARGDDLVLGCIALAALVQREDVPAQWTDAAIRRLRHAPRVEQRFIMRALARRASRPVIPSILSQLDEDLPRDWIAQFISQRLAAGEEVDEESFHGHVPVSLAPEISAFLEAEDEAIPDRLREAFENWRRSFSAVEPEGESPIDMDVLRQFARIWERPYDDPPALLVDRHQEVVDFILDNLAAEPAESLILVGEHGVGKTSIIRAALERLDTARLVFEATAAAVGAGAVYVGQLEGRVEEIVATLRGHETVWVFPGLEEAIYTGQHSRSPQGLLDAILPHIEAGELTIVGEVSPNGYAQLVRERPRVSAVFHARRVRPLEEQDSIAVGRYVLEQAEVGVTASEEVLAEAFDLAQQYLPGIAAPGNLVRLLLATASDLGERSAHRIESGDIVRTLSKATGLPMMLLDPAARLDLSAVRAFLDERVLGQPEAVECLVERVSMIKAGLTDASRPLGVFLFVGPTGTGKTELAKSLAEYLFGSARRLIRLDMSEFQTPDSLERLLSDPGSSGLGSTLLTSVRKDPFAVVLLDEFEKAAAPIWDLFLQVFDDGRLTDLQGQTVDFRHCIIILTSNIGSSLSATAALGFGGNAQPFRPQAVERAVRQWFRPEFLNRIDRVVVFRPFERAQMRVLLEKQLAEIVQRRGLRARPWAIEYDESALAFLLEKGFTPDQGARPLQRAIEQHLLTPLAHAIVEQRVPEGEQFLFVSSPQGRRIEVTFVDPDAREPSASEAGAQEQAPGPAPLDLRSLVLAPTRDPRAASYLLGELWRMVAAVQGEHVQGRKDAALDAMSRPGFWEDDGRFAVLGEAEYLDRLQAALRTANRLGDRLRQHLSRHNSAATDLIELLATRLYVLERALEGVADGIPPDVFLRIRPGSGSHTTETATFTAQLARMYEAWGERRGMRVESLNPGDPAAEHLLAVSGLGAGVILEDEAGFHVLELIAADGDGGHEVERVSASVQVAPWIGQPAPDRSLAEKALAAQATPQQVVRRYRPFPSPLVRDAARGYRTGKLDRVLAGDFDLF